MCIPRELSVVDGKLFQWPVRELDARRRNRVAYEGVRLVDTLTSLDGISGRCIDLNVTVRSADENDPYSEFTLGFAQNEQFYTSLRYRPAKGELKINRTRSGSRRAILHQRKCIVDGERDELTFRLILDRKSAEFFFNDGEQTMTITIPTDQSADGISFFAEGSVLLDVEKFDLAGTTMNQQ
jgi:beta-fructofuranosidase